MNTKHTRLYKNTLKKQVGGAYDLFGKIVTFNKTIKECRVCGSNFTICDKCLSSCIKCDTSRSALCTECNNKRTNYIKTGKLK